MTALRIAVAQGGPSVEAEVSRSSAAGVAGALAAAGHDVVRVELDAAIADALRAGRFDVVFPVTHGPVGEDGCLQGLLEVLGLPYVGPGVLASALAADKVIAKRLFRAAGLPLAKEALVHRGEDARHAARRVRSLLGRALVVKPHAQGSALGVTVLGEHATDDEVARAIEASLAIDEVALCEAFVAGREVTCGVLDAAPFGPARPLPPTEIRPKRAGFYDYASKYAPGGSEHLCPAPLSPVATARVQELAMAAHATLGCRDLSRVDFIVRDQAGDDGAAPEVTLLEVNTLPGMTPTSLYPEAAAVAGIPMNALCDGLARAAYARGRRGEVRGVELPR